MFGLDMHGPTLAQNMVNLHSIYTNGCGGGDRFEKGKLFCNLLCNACDTINNINTISDQHLPYDVRCNQYNISVKTHIHHAINPTTIKSPIISNTQSTTKSPADAMKNVQYLLVGAVLATRHKQSNNLIWHGAYICVFDVPSLLTHNKLYFGKKDRQLRMKTHNNDGLLWYRKFPYIQPYASLDEWRQETNRHKCVQMQILTNQENSS